MDQISNTNAWTSTNGYLPQQGEPSLARETAQPRELSEIQLVQKELPAGAWEEVTFASVSEYSVFKDLRLYNRGTNPSDYYIAVASSLSTFDPLGGVDQPDVIMLASQVDKIHAESFISFAIPPRSKVYLWATEVSNAYFSGTQVTI